MKIHSVSQHYDPPSIEMKQWRPVLGVVSVVTAILLYTILENSAKSGPRNYSILKYGVAASDAGRLDPHVSAAGQDLVVFRMLFNGLFRRAPGEQGLSSIEPDLADSWQVSTDKTQWVFNIRRGVQCHHGYGELTAEDVVFSLRRASNGETSSFAASFSALEQIEVIDRYSLSIRLSSPVPSLLALLTNYQGGNIICKKAIEEMGQQFSARPIGTGPFMFDKYKPIESVSVVANPLYFRGRPALSKVVLLYLAANASRDLALQTREIDVAQGGGEVWIERMSSRENIDVEVNGPVELHTLYLDTMVSPFDDIRVRQAFAHAIDKESIVDFIVGKSKGYVATSIVPKDNLGYASTTRLLGFDPERSIALLREAGYPDGLTVNMIHTNKSTVRPQMEAIQSQLEDVGITLNMLNVDHTTYHSHIRRSLSPIVYYAAARFPVADIYLTEFYHSDSVVMSPTGATNFSNCSAADLEIEAARRESDDGLQLDLWARAQQKIVDEVCGIPIYESLATVGFWNDIEFGYEFAGGELLITEKTHSSLAGMP